MRETKPPIEYASPQPPTAIGRRSRRLRREAFKLLIMAAVVATVATGSFAYGWATGAVSVDERGDNAAGYLAVMLGGIAAVFALAAAMRYLESRSGD